MRVRSNQIGSNGFSEGMPTADEALCPDEACFRALVHNTPDILMRFDREYRHVFVSPNVEETTGLKAESFIGKTHRDLGFPEEKCRFWEQTLEQVFQTGDLHESEFEFEGPRGRVVFNWRLIPENNATGQTEYVLSIARDISEHRKVEQEYALLFSLMPDGFALHEIIVDDAGRPCDYRFLSANPAFEELTGLKMSEVVGRTVLEVLPDIEPEWIARFGDVALTGKPTSFENYSRELGRYYEVTAYCPRPGQFAAVFHDTTERMEAQRTAQQNNLLLAIASRTARMGGWQVNLNEKRVVWSDEVAAIHDKPPGQPPSVLEAINFYAPEWRDKITQVFTACAQQGTAYDEEMQIITAKGRRVWVRTIGEAERDASGKIVGVHGAFMDISERKRSEACVFESENRYRNLFVHSPDAIFINHDDVISQANRACLELFGAKDEFDLIGKPVIELLHPDYHKYAPERTYRLRTLGKPMAPVEEKIIRLDGRVVDVETAAAPFPYDDTTCIHVIMRDITERKRATEQLARAADEWQRTFNATNHAIWIMDKHLRVLRANNASQRFVNAASDQIIGRPCYGLLHDSDEPIENCPIVKAKETLARESADLQLGDRWVEVTVDPILDEDGRFDGAVHIINDITDRKRAEQALIEKCDELERFNRVTVGRELQMVRLKQKVNALLEELGRPTQYETVP